MKLLITGATGFVGAATVRKAIEAGHTVTALVRDPASLGRLEPLRGAISLHGADLRTSDQVDSALAATRPDAVLHLAWAGVANTARNDMLQVYDNLVPTCRLLELSAHHGVRKFVGLGSQGEYGPLNKVITERDQPQPTTLYGASKLATALICERMAEQLSVPFAWMRLFSTYGPGDSDVWMIPSLIRQLLQGQRPQTTPGTQLWDYLYVDDVASAILAVAVSEPATGLFNLGSGRPIQVRAIVEALRDLIDPTADIGFGEIPFRSDQVMHMEADISRLRALTDWGPEIDLQDGLARTIQEMRQRLHG